MLLICYIFKLIIRFKSLFNFRPDTNNELENTKPEKDAIDTKYERTLITFMNDIKDKAFNSAFPSSRRPKPRSKICAVTK